MSTPAYDALPLTDTEKISARHSAQVAGQPSAAELIEYLRKHGQEQSVLEAALTLSDEDYRAVETAYRKAKPPEWQQGQFGRRRRGR